MRRVALVSNRTSGGGRAAALVAPVTHHLMAAGIAVTHLHGHDATDARRLLADAVAAGVDAVVALGGDGTVHLVLQEIAATGVALGIIPAGTGNDFAAALAVPGDPIAAAGVVAAGHLRTVDAVRADQGWWCCVLGAGFDSNVTERANALRWPRGRRRYDLAIAAELGALRTTTFDLELDGRALRTEALMVTLGNAPSYGGGLRIAPDARLDDGLLEVVVIHPVSRRTLVRMLPRLRDGSHVSHPAVEVHRARRVAMTASGQVAYADGERLGPLPLVTEVVPGALQVLVPGGSGREGGS